MSTVPLMPQNDREERDDVSVEHVKRLHRPSLLKDPTTLFDTPGTNDRLSANTNSSRTEKNAHIMFRQLSEMPFREDVFGTTMSGKEHISIDQQLTWLIPALANLERIKKMSSFVKKDGNSFLKSSSIRWVSSGGIMCLYAGILIALGRIPARKRSKK